MLQPPTATPELEDRHSLSPMQEGMLLHWLRAPRSGVDIEQVVCTFREAPDTAALRLAWEQVVARHPALRAAFRCDGPLGQEIPRAVALPWSEEDWHDAPPARFEQWLQDDRRRGFDLDRAPLLRVALLRTGGAEWRMVWTFHHALLDGRSIVMVLGEVSACYEAARRGAAAELPARRPFRDFVAWQRTLDFSASETFWRARLAGFRCPTPVPFANLPGCEKDPCPGSEELRLSAETTARLRALASREGFTLNTIVQGAWALLLSRCSGEADIVFGATRACRRSPVEGAMEMIGLLINTLPVRTRVAPDAPLLPWLRELRAQWVAMREHEQTPLSQVQAWSEVPAGERLFDSLVVFEHRDLTAAIHAAGAWLGCDFRIHEMSGFALTLAAYDGEALGFRLDFDRARFPSAAIARMLRHFETLLTGISADPVRSLGALPLLSPEEERALLAAGAPQAPAPPVPDAALHELFSRQAARTPDALALTCGEEQMTYAELDGRSTALAAHLRARGAGPGTLVALLLERSPMLIVALLGILKSGAAYVPIDPAYPRERIGFMLEDSAASLIATESRLQAELALPGARVVCVDEALPAVAEPANPTGADLDSAAYVIYTSGSTGQPKGTLVTHRNVARLFTSTAPWFGFGASDVWTLFHSAAFDFSVWEIWGALLHGGRLVIVPRAISRSPEDFRALLAREKVTVLNQTPSAFRQLIAADERAHRTANTAKDDLALRWIIFGGEALDPTLLRPWFERHGDEQPRVANMYGITETTVHVTFRRIRRPDLEEHGTRSLIGVPIPGLQLYLLDPALLRPVPAGAPGEIFVGGAGVARGYLGRPDLTAQRFIPHPFVPGERLYRSGDLARWLEQPGSPALELEYLGRRDAQVKVRGHRVELGEIETLLTQHPAVTAAAVAVQPHGNDARLVACLVADRGSPRPTLAEIRARLGCHLPEYMVPSALVFLDCLPLTPHGKLDRRALPASVPPQSGDTPVACALPRTALEQSVAAIWRELLGVEAASLDSNFFDLGGHSLLLIQLHARLRALGANDLALTELFQRPTIRAQAERLGHLPPDPQSPGAEVRDRAARQRAARPTGRPQARQSLSSSAP